LASLATGRSLLAAATGADGRIYAIGGHEFLTNAPTNVVEAYDLVTDTWTTVAPMHAARQGLAAVAGPNGAIYAIGGSDRTHTFLPTVEVYDPSTNAWTQIADLPRGLRNLAAAQAPVGGISRIFAIGGHGETPPFTSMEVYSP